jgi:hypothetical protein
MRSKHEFPQPGSHGTEPPSQGGAQIAFPVFPAHSHSEVTLPKVPDVIDASPIGPSVVSISGYTYSMFDVQLTTDGKKHKAFADTGCSRPLVDGDWLAGHPDFSIDTEYS